MAVPILIIGPENDLHGKIVARRLEQLGARPEFWSTTLFPWVQRASWTPGDSMKGRYGAPPDLSAYHKVWWRRYKRPTASPSIEDSHVKAYCASEAEMMLRALFSLEPQRMVNDPERERAANRKIFQLTHAKKLNISIPDTLISNDASAIANFVQSKPRTIVKSISNGYPHSIETRECTKDDFSNDKIVGLAPHIYQELVEATKDIRVFTVGDSAFAGELDRTDVNTRVDWRMLATGWRPHQLSADCAHSLLQLTRQLGLHTASHDLRLTADGEYIYLETNPAGQFLFLEIDCGLPLSSALARHLIS